jgi:hypothetical protein
MSDFMYKPTEPPGKTDPPLDQIKPTDDGWSKWVQDSIKTFFHGQWSKDCKVAIGVVDTGVSKQFPLEGTRAGKWEKEANTRETQPPAAYKDFTRFRRKYKPLKTRWYTLYRATITVQCPGQDPWTWSADFWKPHTDPPITWPEKDVHRWVQTSGLKEVDGPGGTKVTLKWYHEEWAPSEYTDPSEDDTTGNVDPPPEMFVDLPTFPSSPFAVRTTRSTIGNLNWVRISEVSEAAKAKDK